MPRRSRRLSLHRELEQARARTDALFSLVRPDSLYDHPISERHRIIFYLGHLEAFDWNLMCQDSMDMPSFQPAFDRLFAFGIDPDSAHLPQDQPSDWPRVDQVRAYNATVREKLGQALDTVPEQLLHVAIEHRLMHAETFAYVLHNMPYDRKQAPPARPRSGGQPIRPRMVEIPGGRVVLGRKPGDGFGWDNEFQEHQVARGPFAIGKYKVMNGEYLAFVEAGGPAPHFWRFDSGGWRYRGMFKEMPLPKDWPVYVTHDQAVQYAAWAGKRLPTEAEFQRAAYGAGEAAGDPARDNFDFHQWDPVPVAAAPANGFGVVQMVGNGWEWTSTVFHPFPGFEAFSFYRNYSEPFFDGQHYVLKGASPRTAARLTRASFRNWFRGSYPYVYASFRLAEG